MRYLGQLARRVAIVVAALPPAAIGQDVNILDGAPPTRIYVETTYDANAGRNDCDWYAAGHELLAALQASTGAFATDCVIDIRLRGTLNQAGARQFAALVAALAESKLTPAAVVLDSKGGDTDAALAIARSIRHNAVFRRIAGGVATRVDAADSSVCFSACVVVFAAGYRRAAEFNIYGDPALPSRLGIHSPGQFDRNASRYDTSHANREIMRIRTELEDYFVSVGAGTEIVEDMFAVPFDKLKLLTEADLLRYGLAGPQD